MPRNKKIKKVLLIGSGPIVIGQAAEFDYAGGQACTALKEEGLEVVLVNSNPATIMTDHVMADEIYLEPLTLETVKRIIDKEKPDSLLSTLGGQTGLNLSMQLAKDGFLASRNVRLLGANPETIDKAEDRQIFKDTMLSIGEPVIPSAVVQSQKDAVAFAAETGYPVIVRPAFTLGGAGGGIASDEDELREIAAGGLRQSPIHQILVEKSVAGWKEIEFEVMRDSAGNVITVCSMENLDPVGVHTGDSIVAAPALTLSDREYQMLRSSALKIISAMGIEGGCNCQFALHPESFDYAVIEVNPRVSRSSALASKAAGYPIAKVAAKIAIGYTLDEIANKVTGKTYACFEPALDYVVVKLPRWPFDKFVYAKRKLGTQMMSTGEVMSIASNFEAAMMKAVRGAEIGLDTLSVPRMRRLEDAELEQQIRRVDDERVFYVYEALRRGMSVEALHSITGIDEWFLCKLRNLARLEARLETEPLCPELYRHARRLGFPDQTIRRITGQELPEEFPPVFKMVDTCGAEFEAQSPYFYSDTSGEDEALPFIRKQEPGKGTVVVLGSGPIRIGQGIEFDYACVHCVLALKTAGYRVVMINNNPETVSTDFSIADRLYFEPLTVEDVLRVLDVERPVGVVVAFGGQTAIKLSRALEQAGIRILGTGADSIDAAEDRERFDALLERHHIQRPAGYTAMTEEEALAIADRLGYPVLLRPSYVLGGQNMIIASCQEDVSEYMKIILSHKIENPVLIDQYLMGTELEVDAICDGEEILIPGVMEHIERAGVHSGDSIAVYPAWNISGSQTQQILEYTRRLALGLQVKGLVNVQYVIHNGRIYVIEVNPRASRTVPYISKVTGVPMVDLAVRAMLGESLRDMGYEPGIYPTPPYLAVKVPVFSYEKLADVDTHLGPEMKSTGEVLGIGKTFDEAIYKGLAAAGYRMARQGGVLITVRDSDKPEICDIAEKYHLLGFTLYATRHTAETLRASALPVTVVDKIHESAENTKTLLESGKICYIISTSSKGRLPARDSVKLRRRAVELGIPCLTSLDTADALANSLRSRYTLGSTELVDINHMRTERETIPFVKMQDCGNDYVFVDCLERRIDSPESLSILLTDRHYGIGGDGLILIEPSLVADVKMRIFNRDGSEAQICGNGTRFVGKYLFDTKKVSRETIRIETLSGIKQVTLFLQNGQVLSVTTDMGKAGLRPEEVPVRWEGEAAVSVPLEVNGETYSVTCVSLGNPHCVVFCEHLDGVPLDTIGPAIENAPIFPEKTNVEFVRVLRRNVLKMRVWERGTGETLCCGTGACAAAVAAVLNGFCDRDEDIVVKLKGGELVIRDTERGVAMTGAARTVFEGVAEV